jgi:lipopolysaccharide export system permease protein
MKKLQNYFAREVMHTMLLMMLIFLGIMICIVFIRYLSMAASGEMSLKNAIAMLGIIMPNFINLLIPITLFLSLIITINRLLYDSELVTAFACGVGWFDLVKWLYLPGFLLALLNVILSFWVVPKMAYYQDNLLQISSQNASMASFLETGRFFYTGTDNQVIYVGAVNFKTGVSQQIFIYRKIGNVTELILAPQGQITEQDKLSQLTLLNGHEYQGVLGTLAYQMVHFGSFNLLMIPTYNTDYTDKSTFPVPDLIRDHGPGSKLELEWRSSTPLMTLVLTVLGVMLSDVRPRKSKYIYFLAGTAIFIIYFNGLSIARSMVITHALPMLPGLYLVHGIFFGIALFLLAKREVFFSSLFTSKRREIK